MAEAEAEAVVAVGARAARLPPREARSEPVVAVVAVSPTFAETDWPEMSLCEPSGVCTRHAAFSGVVSAHAGSWTRRSRPDQPPPYAEANAE